MKFYNFRTNCNKLNNKQKDIMAHFMSEHTHLPKNSLPNCAQGRSTANRLWEELSKQLNAPGPPIKNAKLWKKVYADQKYNAKRKLSFNKISKRQTGGGPYQQRALTPAEEVIVEAAGLEASVSGNSMVQTYGSSQPAPVAVASRPASSASASSRSSGRNSNHSTSSVPSRSSSNSPASCTPSRPVAPTPRRRTINKASLLEENIKLTADHHKAMGQKIDRLLQIKERQLEIDERQLEISERQLAVSRRILAIKEEKHRAIIAVKELNLKIKSIELNQLKVNEKEKK
ncbi:uncharacterized protein LOC128864993 [Anastrepha ludens]|uniref:uncharacterized protein LOC128864993 n=1 Tax=Anastrepha ludens TaxID=28586 RepID=UPI0023AEA9E2|nr:uncharacterized protein LOC128864993 [Anastrepha ludens]